MREWCLVIRTFTPEDARRVCDALGDRQLDLEVEVGDARVLCFAESEPAIRWVAEEIRQTLLGASLWQGVVRSGHAWVWSDQLHRYVDPQHPGESLYSGMIDPDEIRWRVRLDVASVHDYPRVRRELRTFRSPVIETSWPRHIDLGATDASDAEEVARAGRTLTGVTAATPSEIRGRLERWLIRQHLLGNYAETPPGASGGGG